MKYILALCFVVVSTISVNAQIHNPVKWPTSVEKVSDSEYGLVATATIDMGWHLYLQTVPEGGPIATNFSFKSNPNYLKKEILKKKI
jgi:thiol:disulfide interchange protein DsbD